MCIRDVNELKINCIGCEFRASPQYENHPGHHSFPGVLAVCSASTSEPACLPVGRKVLPKKRQNDCEGLNCQQLVEVVYIWVAHLWWPITIHCTCLCDVSKLIRLEYDITIFLWDTGCTPTHKVLKNVVLHGVSDKFILQPGVLKIISIGWQSHKEEILMKAKLLVTSVYHWMLLNIYYSVTHLHMVETIVIQKNMSSSWHISAISDFICEKNTSSGLTIFPLKYCSNCQLVYICHKFVNIHWLKDWR